MKLALSSLLIATAVVPVFGQAPFLRPMASRADAPIALQRAPEQRTILNEDFGAMTAGSESTPDSENIANLRTGEVDARYTSVPGWAGAGIYQAGGICAILTTTYQGDGQPYEDTGFLATPQGDYSGALKVSFRARLTDDETIDSDRMGIVLGSTDKGVLEALGVNISKQWQTFNLDFSKGLFSNCLIQFAMQKACVLIDDISVVSTQTSIIAPVAVDAVDFRDGGFTARWNASDQATDYKVTIYEKDTEGATSIVDFEDVNTTASGKYLDLDNPGLPEGWTFVVNQGNSTAPHVSMQGAGGSRGIVFNATDEGFATPIFDAPVRDFSFYGRSLWGKPCFSKLKFAVYYGGQWRALGDIDIERIAADGELIDLSAKLPDGVYGVMMRYVKDAQNDAGKDIQVLIDDIKVMTEPARAAVAATATTNATTHRIEGLDAEKDYSFTVTAVNAEFSSTESNEVMAVGLEAPRLDTPSALNEKCYTARWHSSPKAEGYSVNHYMCYTAPRDGEATILEENFDKVTRGTLDQPFGLYNTFNPLSLDEYTVMPGWQGLATYLVKGMLGTRSYYTVQGAIQTPALDLSGNNGCFDVEMTVVADTDAAQDKIVVQAGQNDYKQVPVEKTGDPFKIRLSFECGTTGMPLLIYSYRGSPFYIDDIKVSRHVLAGEKIFTLVSTHDTSDTEYELTNVVPRENEQAAYRVFAFRNFYGGKVYSVSSDVCLVPDQAGVEQAGASDASRIYLSGGKIHVHLARPSTVTVTDIAGRTLAKHALDAGHTAFDCPFSGPLLVSAGGKTVKIAN